MAIIKKTVYLHHKVTEFGAQFYLADSDFSILDQYTLIATREIEFDIGNFDGREKEIDVVEKALEKVRAESQSQINILLDRISKLKALTHEVSQ